MLPHKTLELSSTSFLRLLTIKVTIYPASYHVSFQNERHSHRTATFNLLLYQNMEGQYPCTIVTDTGYLCFTPQCTQQQIANTTINGMINQLSFGRCRHKFVRIMTCLCPMNIPKYSQCVIIGGQSASLTYSNSNN